MKEPPPYGYRQYIRELIPFLEQLAARFAGEGTPGGVRIALDCRNFAVVGKILNDFSGSGD